MGVKPHHVWSVHVLPGSVFLFVCFYQKYFHLLLVPFGSFHHCFLFTRLQYCVSNHADGFEFIASRHFAALWNVQQKNISALELNILRLMG